MKKKFNVNILARIAVLVALCVVALAVATAMNLSAMSSTRMQDRQDELVALATTAYNVVDGLGKQVDAGQLTAEAAQKAATATLSTMRYGKTGYIFVINADGVSLVNPNAPETVGKNLSENTDANGKHFTADMIAGGKANGSGFEAYQYIKVQGQPPVDKVSYYVFYKPWGWVIGTGVYLDDMAAANQADMWRGLATGGSIALVLVLAAWLLARTITGPINRITHTMETIAEGSYDVEVKGAERGDEIGKMARAVEVFRQNGVRVREMSAGELASSEERVRLRAALMQQLQKEFGQVVELLSPATSPSGWPRPSRTPSSTSWRAASTRWSTRSMSGSPNPPRYWALWPSRNWTSGSAATIAARSTASRPTSIRWPTN